MGTLRRQVTLSDNRRQKQTDIDASNVLLITTMMINHPKHTHIRKSKMTLELSAVSQHRCMQ